MTEQITQHGVFLTIYNTGVLLTGPSNIGKSESALGLIERGHYLIADDCVILKKENSQIIGCCPPAAQGFLAIRDLGIINVTKLFGQQVISNQKKLELIIKFTACHEKHVAITNTHLQGVITMQNLMSVNIPQQTILVKPNRNLVNLIETSVRLHQLRQTGYDACADFVGQQQLIDSLS